MDTKCRDKFLVQSVAISSDKEFSNLAAIVRSLGIPFRIPYNNDTGMVLTNTYVVGWYRQVSSPGEEDQSRVPRSRRRITQLWCRAHVGYAEPSFPGQWRQ